MKILLALLYLALALCALFINVISTNVSLVYERF